MNNILSLIIPSLNETLFMVGLSTLLTILLGLPLGITLVVTDENHILPNKSVNRILSWIINITRSLPFIILMVFIIPFTRFVVGTTLGTKAAIVPLVIAATPFYARVVESSIREIQWGVIEASLAMGATPMKIITQVLIPEATPSLVLGITITLINIVGYSAMAGAIGGGGLGDLAIRYGYQRFRVDIMWSTIIVLILLVQIIQSTGNKLASLINKK
ncbi:methionine ABC transporter permease [Anaeromicrobium sediminis]|uniref:Methionine ABC transporter permease n=1 Tax=Anaeromicrobium sediminis TaxID=1478221 RepID=A0A267MIA2_9FIRM|nr:methionine ABC transporter permease [Anaeromicrobium sediminis]PAB59256.1 methionine ABC transporter permease [Anaeromicrobium sediminis]